jgi:hypothetical protein
VTDRNGVVSVAAPSLCRGYDEGRPVPSISYARDRIFQSIRRACWRRRMEESNMTLFYSHQDQFRDLAGASRSARPSSWQMFAISLRRHAWWALRRAGAALKIMHHAAIAARMRRVERELMFQNGSYDRWFYQPDAPQNQTSDKDAVKFPQRPLLLGDKWDF